MSMLLRYDPVLRSLFPKLYTGTLTLANLDGTADPSDPIARLNEVTNERLADVNEGEFPEIQAWRRAFSVMGLKPTQYRCASEALLRRYRKEGSLPALHPLIDLCNAASLAFAIPVAVFDRSQVAGVMTVRPARGDEVFETFGGQVEHPDVGEIIFADESNRAHARRWTNRQSGWSAISAETREALIVAEALHDTGAEDVAALCFSLTEAHGTIWGTSNAAGTS